MSGRRKEDEERRSGTYRAVEGSIKEDECGEAGCLVIWLEILREHGYAVREQDRLPCLWSRLVNCRIAGLIPTSIGSIIKESSCESKIRFAS